MAKLALIYSDSEKCTSLETQKLNEVHDFLVIVLRKNHDDITRAV